MNRLEKMLERIIERISPTARRRRMVERAQRTTQPVRRLDVSTPPSSEQFGLTLLKPDRIFPRDEDQTPPIQ